MNDSPPRGLRGSQGDRLTLVSEAILPVDGSPTSGLIG